MNAVLWILQILLAALFAVAGAFKLLNSKSDLAGRMTWVEEFPEQGVLLIGWAELTGAIGLLIPALTGVAPLLVPVAASGLALMQLGALAVHSARGENQMILNNAAILVVCLFVSWGRFAPSPL